MKRVISLLAVLALCFSLAVPVLAEEFVPSITDKGSPDIVPVEDEEGNEYIGVILDENGNVIGYLNEKCLVVTPVSKAKTSTLIPDAAEQMLLDVYDQLVAGTMDLPFDKFNANLDPDSMVIRDLFDVSWLCGEDSDYEEHPDHPTVVEPKGITVRITFNLGVSKNAAVYTMSYKRGAWNPIVSTVNNGDGTVTCTFEDFCPVAISVGDSYVTPPAQTGDNSDITLWIVLMAVSVVALGAVLVFSRRKVA